jgi:hypothetical protein
VKIQEPPKCLRTDRPGTGPLYIYMSAHGCPDQARLASHPIKVLASLISLLPRGELTQLTVTDQGNYGILTGRSLPIIPLAPSDDRPKPQREPGGSPPRLAPPIAMAANSGISTTSPLFCRMRQPLHDHSPRRPLPPVSLWAACFPFLLTTLSERAEVCCNLFFMRCAVRLSH